jgi:hypothetical protein
MLNLKLNTSAQFPALGTNGNHIVPDLDSRVCGGKISALIFAAQF